MTDFDFDDTLAYVCAMYAVSPEAVASRDRSRRNSYARGMVAILMRERGHSYSAIGRAMNREHTSIMRMVRLGKKIVDRALKHFMSREEMERAEQFAAEARLESERQRERDIAEIEEAVGKVYIIRPEMKQYDRNCPLTRRWMTAIARTEAVAPERKEAVWRDEMERLFPFTAGTPTATYGEAQAA